MHFNVIQLKEGLETFKNKYPELCYENKKYENIEKYLEKCLTVKPKKKRFIIFLCLFCIDKNINEKF